MRFFLLLNCCLLMLLSGCGFALRGTTTPLPARFEKTYFHEIQHTDDTLHRRVKRLITLSGGKLVERSEASVSIALTKVEISSRQIALSGNGSVKEYERTYYTTVTVTEITTGIQLGSRVLSTKHNVQLDDRRVLAGEEQSAVTQDVAERSLAQAVMRYLKSF